MIRPTPERMCHPEEAKGTPTVLVEFSPDLAMARGLTLGQRRRIAHLHPFRLAAGPIPSEPNRPREKDRCDGV